MTDIFQEVEEDVRRERFEKIWKQYGDYIIAAVAAVAVGVAGYKLWNKYELQKRMEASRTFVHAETAAESGNSSVAQAEFAQLAKSGPAGYSTAAKLAQANTVPNRGEALAIYKTVAEKDSSPLASAARIRAAWIMVDTVPKSEVETWLAPLNVESNGWHYMAREILAYADYRAGATDAAQRQYRTLADSKDAPAGLRGRSNAMAIFLKAGGEKNFGVVPKPAPEPVQGLPEGLPPEVQQQLQRAMQGGAPNPNAPSAPANPNPQGAPKP